MGVMSNALEFISQTWTYRGREGHWAWILHRLAGIGVFIFLAIHIIDIWLIGFGPQPFNTLAIAYHHPVARFLHIFLFFSVLYHAVNGVRIIIMDFWPKLWKYQKQSVWITAVIFLLVFIPTTVLIIMDIVIHL